MSGLPAWADVEPSPSDQPRHGPSAPYTPKPSGSWLRRLLGLSWAWLFAGCWAQAPADPRALDFAKNFSDHCLNSRANWSLKRDELNRRWRKLASPQSASFLSGQAGQAWHVPSVENEGNMVLSMGSKKEFCALFARRAERLEAERLFQLLVTKDRKSTRLNSSHVSESRMPSSA